MRLTWNAAYRNNKLRLYNSNVFTPPKYLAVFKTEQYSKVHAPGVALTPRETEQSSRVHATGGLCRQEIQYNTHVFTPLESWAVKVQYNTHVWTPLEDCAAKKIQYNTHVFMPLEGCASKKYSTILTCSRNWRAVPPRNTVQYSRVHATGGLCRQ